MKPTKSLLALSITSALITTAVQAAPSVVPTNGYAIAAGTSFTVTVNLDAAGTQTSIQYDKNDGTTGTATATLGDDYYIQTFKVTDTTGESADNGLFGMASMAPTGTRSTNGDTVATINGAANEGFTTGLYQLMVCQSATYNADLDNDAATPTTPATTNCATMGSTTISVEPAAATARIALVDNMLTRIANTNAGTFKGLASGAQNPAMDIQGSRNALMSAAWLSRMGYEYDVVSSLSLEATNNDALADYDVVIIADRNSVWTTGMRASLDSFLATEGKGVMFLGAGNLTHTATQDGTTLTIAADGDTSASGLDNAYGGEVNGETDNTEGTYTVLNADHWAFAGTDLTAGALFGNNATLTKRIVGWTTDGSSAVTQGTVPATTVPVASTNYEVLAYADAANGVALPGLFQSAGTGAWVFNAATVRWAEGLTDIDNQYQLLADDTVSTITKTVLDTFLTDCSTASATTANDGVMAFCGLEEPVVVPTCETGFQLDTTSNTCVAVTTDDNTDDSTDDTTDDNSDDTDDTTTKSSGGGATGLGLLGLFGLMGLRRRIK